MLEPREWIKKNTPTATWCPTNGICSEYSVTLVSLDEDTLPYKFGSVKNFNLLETNINNFVNFPSKINDSLFINDSKITTLVGLENVDIGKNIYVWNNIHLEFLNDEINEAIMDGSIYDIPNQELYIQTKKNRVYIDRGTLLKIDRRLKLKQFTNE